MPGAGSLTIRGGRWLIPSQGAALAVGLAATLEAISRVVAAPRLSIAAAGVLGAVVAAALATPPLRGLEVRLQLPDRMAVGAESEIRIAVLNHQRRPRARYVIATLSHPALPRLSRTVRTARIGATPSVARVVVQPIQRGRWSGVGRIEFETVSMLGGWRRRWRLELGGVLIVHPAMAAVLPIGGTGDGAGQHTDVGPPRPDPSGDEVVGLREWRPGDHANRISWRATARTGRLVVVERHRLARPRLAVVVGMPGRGQQWEGAISRVAATTVSGLAAGAEIEIFTGRGSIIPRNAREALDAFAALEFDGPADLHAPRLRSGEVLIVLAEASTAAGIVGELGSAGRRQVINAVADSGLAA